jgi:hypothetical protein
LTVEKQEKIRNYGNMSSTNSLLLFLRMIYAAPKRKIAGYRGDRSFPLSQGYLSSSHPTPYYSRRFMMTSGKDDKDNKKSNFDRDVLLPASRGELVGDKPHTSGIPKLAARRNKAHLGPVSRSSGLSELYDNEFMDDNDEILTSDGIRRKKGSPYRPSLRNDDGIVLDRTGAYTSIDQMLQEDDGTTFTEEDWHEMDRLLQQAIRDVAEVAITFASAQKHGESENAEKQEAVLKRLKDAEQKIVQKTQRFTRRAPLDDTDDDRRLKSKVTEQLACTHLPRGIRPDGSPSLDAKRPPPRRNEESEAATLAASQNALLAYDPNFEIDDFHVDENGALVPQRETEETRMIQRDAVLAYAQTLDLDLEFGYWCEMDYDTDPQSAEILEAKHIEELNQHAKEETEKKAALAKILEEAENENEDATSTEVSIDEGEATVPEVKLTERQQKELDFVTWFCKENDILEYENDPTLVAADQIKNNPRLQKKLQEQQWSGSGEDVLNSLTVEDERDKLYGDHPQSIELCSGTDEYIEVDVLHPHQKREPKPYFRLHTQQPDLTFVDTYKRFAFVANLPPLFLESTNPNQRPKPIDLSNPVDRTLFQRHVSRLFRNVELDQVFPASTTSAWIGYRDSVGLAETLVFGPDDDILKAQEQKIPTPSFEPLPETLKEHKFVKNSSVPDVDKCIVLLSLPDGSRGKRYTSISLARDLFASKALAAPGEDVKPVEDIENVLDVASVYGNVTPADIFFVNSTSALVRLASPEQAASVLDSDVLRARLIELNTSVTVQVFRARRELVHRGWNRKYGTDRGKDEVRKLGPRLIVDGDMPTKLFYTSHAGVIMLRGVDPYRISKHDISTMVQPYCELPRDSEGSIEWVECNHNETRADRVYVGFDLVGEAEKAAKGLGVATLLLSKDSDDPSKILVKLLRDRQPPNYPLPALQRRPDRSTEELLLDLNHWEQHVDPFDIEYLEKAGISKHILDESLRAIRYNNDTFGPLDYAMRNESLEPYKSTGEQYRELVRLYISSLKECVATPENPGKMFELLQYPNQEVDLEIFEYEAARVEKMKQERGRA